jgi:hypothetical protein
VKHTTLYFTQHESDDNYLDARRLAQAGTITQSVSTKSEVRFRSTITVSKVQKQADSAARELRELDARIQEANWLIDLLE